VSSPSGTTLFSVTLEDVSMPRLTIEENKQSREHM
jgi:hypothetical protein